MKVQQINRAINALGRIPSASEVSRGYMLEVCEASPEDWDAFVASENQALRSTHMQLVDGRVMIVEFPSDAHGNVSSAVGDVVRNHPVVRQYLFPRRDSYNKTPGLPRYEPDESFRPSRAWLESIGVDLPAGLAHWSDFVTLRVEVGASRGWGDTEGYLDHKARTVWSQFPGVAFVLCIVVDDDLQLAEYKLYEIPGLNIVPALIPNATPITPRAIEALDARRLLGIPAGLPLPPGFPDPFPLNLFAVLQEARLYARQ